MARNFVASSLQHLSVPDTAVLDIIGELTIAVHCKSTGNYASNRGIVAKFQGVINQRSYQLYVGGDGKPTFLISPNGGSNSIVNSPSVIGTSWAHLAGVFTPSTRQELFLNGVSSAVITSGVIAAIHSGTAPLTVGYQNTVVSNNCWDGDIAEVGIWSAALTAAEITSLAKGMTCDKIRPQNLVFYAPLVRDLQDVRGGLTITNNNGAVIADHPRIYA